MSLSLSARIFLAVLCVAGLVAYLVIVDLGINAGRVHYGVSVVGGVNLGGLTEAQASAALSRRVKLLNSKKIVFGARGVERLSFYPSQLGWRPKPSATAEAAMAVGRTHGVLRALFDRVRAWLSGIDISWAGTAKPGKVTHKINAVEKEATALGEVLNRAKFRYKIKRAIVTWPRRPWYRIPIEKSRQRD